MCLPRGDVAFAGGTVLDDVVQGGTQWAIRTLPR